MVGENKTNYVWLIDGRNEVSLQTIEKIARLAKDQIVSVLFDKRQKEKERSFWLSKEKQIELDKIWQELDSLLETKIEKIKARLDKARIDYRFDILSSTDYKGQIHKLADGNGDCTLILQLDKPEVRHPIFQVLPQLKTNTLILTQKEWPKTMSILGCVDPLHEHARPEELDDHIVHLTQTLGDKLKAKWTIAHAFFTPPMFLKYRSQFEQIHHDGLFDFAAKHDIKKTNLALLRGLPEHSIPSWIEQNDGSLLILGIVARNNLVSKLIGSTTMTLLQNPPADLLLIAN